jgi:uncharacterized protein
MKQTNLDHLNNNPVLQKIAQKVIPILKGAGVKRASIFGSFVRGDNRKDSDVDLLIDFPKEKSLFDLVGLQLELENSLNKKVDLVEYDYIKPRLRDQILNEQISIL